MDIQSKTLTDDELTDKLWDWACKLDQHVLDEFGIATVGIGALFFAYGTIQTINVKLIVALIGLAASLVLWSDMIETKQRYDIIMKKMAERNSSLVQSMKEIRRESALLSRWFQQPTTRIMSSFMLLVAWAWAVIIIFRLSYQIIHGIGVNWGIPSGTSTIVVEALYAASGMVLVYLGLRLRSGRAQDKKLKL